MSKWMLKQCSQDIAPLAAELGISNTVAHLLYVRGYKTVEEMRCFLNIENSALPDAGLFLGMREALRCVGDAIDSGKKITVFGDYDADGIMSTVILCKTLSRLGANIDYYIPDRESEGYGLNIDAIKFLREERKTEVIIACDNGISALEQLEYAHQAGLVTVVIDHHDVLFDPENKEQFFLPQADALINPKIPTCPYPFKKYCAGGLCYRFAEAFYAYRNADWNAVRDELLVLAAIATVCDLVELCADNRKIVKSALPIFKSVNNCGLQTLLSVCGLADREITTYHIGYIIGPCINASGRLLIAGKAVELFLSENADCAFELARELSELNQTRKSITNEGTELALRLIAENEEYCSDRILVLYDANIQASVAGIVAGKIKERFHKPVIVLAGDKDVVKGSCRSIEQYNIFEGLLGVSELLENFGGHPMAAGLSIKSENIERFRHDINTNCTLSMADMEPILHIDKALNVFNADLQTAQNLSILEPFGKGNEAPRFADKNVLVKRISLLGKTGNIIKLLCSKGSSNHNIEIISFYLKESFFAAIEATYGAETLNSLLKGQGGILIDIIYSLAVNEYNGKLSAQLTMLDFRIGG